MLATIISVLIFLVCLLLMLVVLIQNPKGGGLATGFSGSNQMMGVRRTTDFLEKATWTLAALLLVLSVASTSNIGKGEGGPTPGSSTTINKAGDFGNKMPANYQSPVPMQPGQPGAQPQPGQPGAQPPAATPTAPPAAGQKTP